MPHYKGVIMHDLTCEEFRKIIDNSKASPYRKSALKNRLESINGFVFDSINTGTYYLISESIDILDDDFPQLLKYSRWKKHFKDDVINYINHYSGSKKNEHFLKVYSIIKKSNEFNFNNKENQIFFFSLFNSVIKLKTKIEEDSIVRVMYDMFKNKESLNLDFFKEIFAIYIENIHTDQKYQKRVNDIKEWGANQNFTDLYSKYKNIRNIFESGNEEKIYYASSKKYDLKAIAKTKKTKLTIINQNFSYLNNFISEKLKTNSNIHDFIIRDEKIFYKVIVIYEKRDFVIDACIKMHEALFEIIDKSEEIEKLLIQNLWDKLMIKADIEESFNIVNKDKLDKPQKVNKL